MGSFDILRAPISGFVKVNFDGSVRNARRGTGFIIRGPNGKLLATRGSALFEASGFGVELHAA